MITGLPHVKVVDTKHYVARLEENVRLEPAFVVPAGTNEVEKCK